MHNGMHTAHFEVMCVAASSYAVGGANHGSSATANEGNAAFPFQSCSNLTCDSGMTNGEENWVPTSISISTYGNPEQQTGTKTYETESFAPTDAEFEVAESETNATSSLASNDSGSGIFALKEHDYIGLSSDSSSVEGSQYIERFTTEKYIGNAIDLDSKETELRLGCGPTDKSEVPFESARVDIVQSDTRTGSVGGNSELATVSAALIEKDAISATVSKGSTLQQGPQELALEAGCQARNARNELCLYVDSDTGIVANDTNIYSPRVLTKSFSSQETVQSWNREGCHEVGGLSTVAMPLISQCGLAGGSRLAEREFFLCQERVASEIQGQDIKSHREKEQSWSPQSVAVHLGSVPDNHYGRDNGINKSQHPEGLMQDTFKQETPNQLGPYQNVTEGVVDRHRDFSRDHGNPFSSFNFPQDEKSSGNPVSSVPPKYWQLPIFRPPDLKGTQSATLEHVRVSSMSNTAGFPAARFAFPVPKITVPAKRGFLEAIGPTIDSRPTHSIENRNNPMDLCGNGLSPCNIPSCPEGETQSTFQAVKHQSSPISYSWNNVFQLPGNLQKGLAATSNCGGDVFSATKDCHMRPPSDKLCARQGRQSNQDSRPDINPVDDNGTSARAPVGWPPIRSFRKNSLTANAKPNCEDGADPDGTTMNLPDASTLYVKVTMDGVPIGRKVDLKSYNCYAKLKLALQDMFQRFLNGHNGNPKSSREECKQLNILEGTEYVLTHEDKDGDWMLVGDVPWEMFVSTVKRLRIMKACDASGLGKAGQRLLPKLKHAENI
eukprot:c17383_g1_i2 orf=1185-3524(+)